MRIRLLHGHRFYGAILGGLPAGFVFQQRRKFIRRLIERRVVIGCEQFRRLEQWGKFVRRQLRGIVQRSQQFGWFFQRRVFRRVIGRCVLLGGQQFRGW